MARKVKDNFGENEVIDDVFFVNEMKKNFHDYQTMVNLSRAIPAIEDGLKPVQRRVVYAMWENGFKPKTMVKAAQIVAATMGDYHPHGDCLAGDTVMVSSDSSVPNTTIEELTEQGGTFPVYAWDNGEIVPAVAYGFRVGQISTATYHIEVHSTVIDEYGKRAQQINKIECTGNHPMLTDDGWSTAEQMYTDVAVYQKDVQLWSKQCGESRFVSVSNIYYEECEPQNMYDFTVDNYESAMILSHDSRGFPLAFMAHNSALYGTAVNMEQDFKFRVPLVHGQGGWGTISNPEASAMRYTEGSMSVPATLMVGMKPWSSSVKAEADEDYIATKTNYNGKKQEPIILPALFPNLVINGYQGVGTGVSGSLPQHDPGEVMDLALYMVDSPNPRLSTVMDKLPGPDIPVGCLIFDDNGGIESYINTGVGSFVMRARHEFVKDGKHTDIVFTNLPQNVVPEMVVEGIRTLVEKKKIPVDIIAKDNTDAVVKVTVDCGKNDPEQVLQSLLFHKGTTCLQTKSSVSNVVVYENRLQTVSVIDCIRVWIDHRKKIIVDRSNHKINTNNARIHILDGFIYLAPIAEEVLQVVRDSENRKDAAVKLQDKWSFSEIQADAILSMNISQLTKVSISELHNDRDALIADNEYLQDIVDNESSLKKVLKEEIKHTKKIIDDGRKSVIMQGSSQVSAPQLSVKESSISGFFAVTQNNWVRWLSRTTNMVRDLDGDYVHRVSKIDTATPVLVVTTEGRGVLLDLLELSKNKKGYSNVKMLLSTMKDGLNPSENIVNIMSIEDGQDVVLFTEKGEVKRLPAESFVEQKKQKMFFVAGVKKEDSIICFSTIKDQDRIGVVSEQGKMVVVDSEAIAPKKGNKAATNPLIKLGTGDKAVSGVVFSSQEDNSLVYSTVSDNMGRIFAPNVSVSNRNTKGETIVRPNESVAQFIVASKDDTLVYGGDDFEFVTAQDVPLGTKMMPKKMLSAAGSSKNLNVSGKVE